MNTVCFAGLTAAPRVEFSDPTEFKKKKIYIYDLSHVYELNESFRFSWYTQIVQYYHVSTCTCFSYIEQYIYILTHRHFIDIFAYSIRIDDDVYRNQWWKKFDIYYCKSYYFKIPGSLPESKFWFLKL